MLFLRDSVKSRTTSGNISESDELNDDLIHIDEVEFDTDDHNISNICVDENINSLTPNRPLKKKQKIDTRSSFENELLKLKAKKVAAILEPQAPEDEDLLFFKSLIPYMKQLHPLQKLRFRSTIQDTLLREISSQQFSNDQNMTNY